MTDKQLALQAIEGLPQGASFHEIRRRIELIEALREAEASLDRGEFVPHEQVEKEFAKWVKKWRTKSSGRKKPGKTLKTYKTILVFSVMASLVMAGSSLRGQNRFTLGFEPVGIECGKTISGFPGEKIQLDILATLTISNPMPSRPGIPGWSIGFSVEGAQAHFLPDTAASGASCGTGEVIIPIPEFFCSAVVVDPNRSPDFGPLAGGPQGEGVVDGLAFIIGKILKEDGTYPLLKVRAEAAFPSPLGSTEEVRIYYRDGLQSSGMPVINSFCCCEFSECRFSLLEECRFKLQSCPCPGGTQRGGDGDQDGELSLNDAVVLLTHLFQGEPARLPCEGGTVLNLGNQLLFDSNGDSTVDVADPVHELYFLFLGGPPHVLGRSCIEMPGCPPGACRE